LWARRLLSESEARRYLAHYLFRGDDVFKRVSELSGGERGRLALALLAIEGANFLLLDEPTNHLDIPAQEDLQEVLEEFPGTILLVSHDRYLIDRLAQQVWAIEGAELHVYAANYQDYLALRDGRPPAAEEQDIVAPTPVEAPPAPPAAPPAGTAEPPRKGWSRQARRQDERRRREVEAALDDAEYWLARTAEALEAGRATADEASLTALEIEHAVAREQVEALLAEWELLA